MGKQYLIDSNAVIDYLAGKIPGRGMDFMNQVVDDIPNISVITKIEILGYKTIVAAARFLSDFVDDSMFRSTPPCAFTSRSFAPSTSEYCHYSGRVKDLKSKIVNQYSTFILQNFYRLPIADFRLRTPNFRLLRITHHASRIYTSLSLLVQTGRPRNTHPPATGQVRGCVLLPASFIPRSSAEAEEENFQLRALKFV